MSGVVIFWLGLFGVTAAHQGKFLFELFQHVWLTDALVLVSPDIFVKAPIRPTVAIVVDGKPVPRLPAENI